jgi:hypothetical protein
MGHIWPKTICNQAHETVNILVTTILLEFFTLKDVKEIVILISSHALR